MTISTVGPMLANAVRSAPTAGAPTASTVTPTTATPTAVTATPVTTAPSGVTTATPGAASAAASLAAVVSGTPTPTSTPATAPSQPAPTPHTHGDSHYHPDLDLAMNWNGTASGYAPPPILGPDTPPNTYVAKVNSDHGDAETGYRRLFLDPRTRIDDPDFGPAAAEKYRNAYNAYTQAREPIMAVRDAEHRIAAAKASGAASPVITGLEQKRDALIAGNTSYGAQRKNYDTAAGNWEKVRDAAGGYSKSSAASVQPFAEAVDVPLTDAQRGALRTARGGGPDDADKSWVDKMNDGLTKTYATADNLFAKPMTTLAGIGTAFQGLQRLFDPLGETPTERMKRQGTEVKGVAGAVEKEVATSIQNMRTTSKDRRDPKNYAYEPSKRAEPSKSAEGLLARDKENTTVGAMLKQHPNYDKTPQQAAGQPAPLNPRDRRDKADEERERRYGRQNMV